MRRSMALLALAGASFTTQAGEVYGGIGLPGLMLGYAHAYSPSLTARVDVATLGSRSGNRTENGIAYAGKIEAHRAGVFGDWFPFAGGFRLTGGVTFNKVGLELGAQPGAGGTITIGGQQVPNLDASDRFDVKIKFPSATPGPALTPPSPAVVTRATTLGGCVSAASTTCRPVFVPPTKI